MKTQVQQESINSVVTAKQHADIKKIPTHTFPHVRRSQLTPVNMHEFSAAATCFPLFFIKNSSNGQLFPVAIFGLTKNDNLYYSDTAWLASYVPLNMKTWPFLFTVADKNADEVQWQVSVNLQNPYLSKTEGEPLFINGKPSPLFERIKEDLTLDMQQRVATANFTGFLIQKKLIKKIKFELGFPSGEKQIVDGIYAIDEDALHNLDSNNVQETYKLGYFQPIYSMLGSQHNLYDLLKRSQAKKDSKSIMSLNIINM